MGEFVWFDDRQVLEYISSEEGKKNLLPAISIASSPECNMACPHCIYDAGKENEDGLNEKQKISLLEEASKIGAKFLQICHDGEPLLDKASLALIEKASELEMKIFMYTNASKITSEIAEKLFANKVRLGVKLDSFDPSIFNRMLGRKASETIYRGLENLVEAGYNQPTERDSKLYTKLCLVTTLTSVNTENIEQIKEVARYAWKNNIFFGIARLEQGGRARGRVWKELRIPDKDKVIELVDWCSEQTGIDYWYAQPTPYCIGVCGMQIADNGNVWITEYGGSCDFTEPDGKSYTKKIFTIGNVKNDSPSQLLQRIWGFRQAAYFNGILDEKLKEYEATKDIFPNGLQDCGSARTYTLIVPFYDYIRNVVENVLK